MPTKHCSWGYCTNDNRYSHLKHMEGVFFIPFPKPNREYRKCLRWIQACGRPINELNEHKIKSHHYICCKHFYGGQGPTPQHPDPIPVNPRDISFTKQNGKRKGITLHDFSDNDAAHILVSIAAANGISTPCSDSPEYTSTNDFSIPHDISSVSPYDATTPDLDDVVVDLVSQMDEGESTDSAEETYFVR